jgi:hypothetical protein
MKNTLMAVQAVGFQGIYCRAIKMHEARNDEVAHTWAAATVFIVLMVLGVDFDP